MTDRMDDDALFKRLAAASDPSALPAGSAPANLKDKIQASLLARQEDDSVFETLAAAMSAESAPPSLTSRIYSALVSRQAESGPLLGSPAVKAGGRELCVFEELVRIAPVGEKKQAFNYCHICHARVIAERMDFAPIYWPGCPYAAFQRR